MIALLVVVAVLVVVVACLAASDRAIARRAEHRAAEYLAVPLGGPATVRVHGEPFLTQALRGRYADVEVTGTGVVLGEISGAALGARLHNAYLPLRALLGRRLAELPCEHVSGNVLIPWTELARLARVPTLLLAHDGSRLVASVSVPLTRDQLADPGQRRGAAVGERGRQRLAADGRGDRRGHRRPRNRPQPVAADAAVPAPAAAPSVRVAHRRARPGSVRPGGARIGGRGRVPPTEAHLITGLRPGAATLVAWA